MNPLGVGRLVRLTRLLNKLSPLSAAVFAVLLACAGSPRAVVDFSQETPDKQLPWLPLHAENGLPVEGLEFLAAKSAGPALEFWAVRADLANPRLGVVVGPAAERPGVVSSITVSGFARRYGCAAAINANPFEPSSAVEGENRTVTGLAISGGTVLSLPGMVYDALVFFAAPENRTEMSGFRRAAILNQQAAFLEGRQIENAAGGFYAVLKNGNPTGAALSRRGGVRHPRSAAGLSPDGSRLFLLVIDGRRPGSAGATEEETALILKRLGASDGLCFDGGGSSALAIRDAEGPKVVNKPAHGFPRRERAVAVCLGIVVIPPAAPQAE
jgi:exopolysaccharide biosynthesis protein